MSLGKIVDFNHVKNPMKKEEKKNAFLLGF